MHGAGFPDRFFQTLLKKEWARKGHTAADLGCGTGTIARGLARAGPKVTGVDIAEPLLQEARALDEQSEVTVSYATAPAEDTSLPCERSARFVKAPPQK